ncbi:cytochrome c oxidase subunit II [Halorubellus sp. JP-L1]|uniref:cytochrome c oxidase subunit II n=1 Tax=Halorubellus sp. JP-L1 TaxID=2715753 RepID=UPI00140DD95B|nr:cytochrome c oxidase subunit II [Halorubellus sp. JP-L1]
MVPLVTLLVGVLVPGQIVPEGSRSVVFQQIYGVFLVLGTIVGIVVTVYMVWKAWKYRASADHGDDENRPELGELPSGGGGGRKLFLSFSLSAIIVVSLISWTYFTLLYVENPEPIQDEEPMTVEVIGHQFYWEFVYPNGHTTQDQLVIPEDRRIRLEVTSADVFHNFGIPELRAKADAIPGQQTSTWFLAEDTGTYQANCYELCGQGHSHMSGTVRVLTQSEFETWYANTTNESANATANESGNDTASVMGSTANVPSVMGSEGATTGAVATSTVAPASPTAAPARHAPVAHRQHGEVV